MFSGVCNRWQSSVLWLSVSCSAVWTWPIEVTQEHSAENRCYILWLLLFMKVTPITLHQWSPKVHWQPETEPSRTSPMNYTQLPFMYTHMFYSRSKQGVMPPHCSLHSLRSSLYSLGEGRMSTVMWQWSSGNDKGMCSLIKVCYKPATVSVVSYPGQH